MKHISIALCLCGMILMNTSCDNYDDTYPQEYEKILSLQTTGEQAVDLYKTGEATNYSITVIKSGSQPTLTASAHIGAMEQSILRSISPREVWTMWQCLPIVIRSTWKNSIILLLKPIRSSIYS